MTGGNVEVDEDSSFSEITCVLRVDIEGVYKTGVDIETFQGPHS